MSHQATLVSSIYLTAPNDPVGNVRAILDPDSFKDENGEWTFPHIWLYREPVANQKRANVMCMFEV